MSKLQAERIVTRNYRLFPNAYHWVEPADVSMYDPLDLPGSMGRSPDPLITTTPGQNLPNEASKRPFERSKLDRFRTQAKPSPQILGYEVVAAIVISLQQANESVNARLELVRIMQNDVALQCALRQLSCASRRVAFATHAILRAYEAQANKNQ